MHTERVAMHTLRGEANQWEKGRGRVDYTFTGDRNKAAGTKFGIGKGGAQLRDRLSQEVNSMFIAVSETTER